MKVFVSGGAGLIGAAVCRKLVEKRLNVVVFDSFARYLAPVYMPQGDVTAYRFNGILDRIEFVRGDTTSKTDILTAIQKHRPDAFIHLAALPNADLAFEHSEEAIRTILSGATNVLEAIRDTELECRFVYASSSMVYGDFQEVPAPENHPKNPKEIYGSLKLAGETITNAFGIRYGIDFAIVRPSAVYGPTDQNRRVIQIFIENAIQGNPVQLHGGGENTLDFTYVDDIAEGFVLAAMHPKASGEIFNMTRGEGRLLKEVVEILQSYFAAFPVEIHKQALYRPKRGALDISKAQDLLGFCATHSLEDGLAKYVEYYQSHVLSQR